MEELEKFIEALPEVTTSRTRDLWFYCIEKMYLNFVEKKSFAEMQKRNDRTFYQVFRDLNRAWIKGEKIFMDRRMRKSLKQLQELDFYDEKAY